jgi:hypothetical protein
MFRSNCGTEQAEGVNFCPKMWGGASSTISIRLRIMSHNCRGDTVRKDRVCNFVILVALSALSLFTTACGRGSTAATSTNSPGPHSASATPLTVSPTTPPNLQAYCNPDYGGKLLDELFKAMNDGDSQMIESLFSKSSPEFDLSPDIDGAVAETVQTAPNWYASSPAEIGGVVDHVRGVQLSLTAPVVFAGPYVDTNPGTSGQWRLALGPIMWDAHGSALQRTGKSVMHGGGKAEIDCKTGLFVKVGLGALDIE